MASPRGMRGFFRSCCLLCAMLAVVLAAGCGKRIADVSEPFTTVSSDRNDFEYPVTLPEDDGIPLSGAEKAAFLSTGDFDTNLSPEQTREVLRYFKHYVHQERGTVRESVERARLYMPYIRHVLKERNLPGDLAYLPFVESNYRVLARSRSGALGMWQFMPSTATYYGMKRNAWMDERRDPYIATRAAATYFERLKEFFDEDWHLAISAYNAGEGKIQRGLDATGADSFFELRARDGAITDPKLKMTRENMQYLPRFLAVCKIMRNLDILGFEPLEAKPVPAMTTVALKPGTHLPSLARAAGMNWETFRQYNALFLRNYSPPGRYKAYVPLGSQDKSVAWLKKNKSSQYANWRAYKVQSRDTAYRIAKRHGITVAELQKINQLDSAGFRPGVSILVPPKKAAVKNSRPKSQIASAGKAGKQKGRTVRVADAQTHCVKPGDTIWSIAKQYNLSPKEVLAVNGMTVSTAHLRPGDVVRLN